MADGRMLKKVVSTSKKLAALKTDSARLLYTWILPHLDIQGRFSAELDIIKGSVVPRLKSMTLPKIEKYLQDLAENKLIILYNVNGDRYLELVKFKDFQRLREKREAVSIIPEPPDSTPTPDELPESPSTTKDKLREVKLSLSEEEVKLSLNEKPKKLFSALDLDQQKKAIQLTEKLERVFEYQTPNERTTFRNIVRHLLDCGMIESGMVWLKEVLQWGSDNDKPQLDMKKCFVSKVIKLSGFKKKAEG
ncbi:hypothetical protein LCGC14_0362370 [marine sediment metagenome]|uniref:DnaD domain-containing protein n=1 Tax=marine sediment metagenome TaxID=412755 RepID=A0A0F9TDN8_9ZZZZ